MKTPRYLGIDVGTSGVRACIVDDDGNELGTCSVNMPAPVTDGTSTQQDSQIWIDALRRCLNRLGEEHDLGDIAALAVDATSSTVLLTLDDGTPLTPALMYNDSSSQQQAERIAAIAPADSGAHGASSSLAKL